MKSTRENIIQYLLDNAIPHDMVYQYNKYANLRVSELKAEYIKGLLDRGIKSISCDQGTAYSKFIIKW
jgi:hypothetical protein